MLAPIAIIGTDASWQQIARDQIVILGDDVGTVLLRTDYHTVAEGYGGKGILLTDPARIDEVLDEAKALADGVGVKAAGLVSAYMVSQGIADAGKEKAKIQADKT